MSSSRARIDADTRRIADVMGLFHWFDEPVKIGRGRPPSSVSSLARLGMAVTLFARTMAHWSGEGSKRNINWTQAMKEVEAKMDGVDLSKIKDLFRPIDVFKQVLDLQSDPGVIKELKKDPEITAKVKSLNRLLGG